MLRHLALAFLLISVAAHAVAAEGTLRRRADLGASIAPPADGKPARIVRFRADSVLEKAGLAVGDQIVELNGQPASDANAFSAAVRALRGGDSASLLALRSDKPIPLRGHAA